MKRKRAMAEEQDYFSGPWWRVLHWRRGEGRRIKRGAAKRERRQWGRVSQVELDRYEREWAP